MLVVIDGLDASGKSTQAEMLAEYLRGCGKTCVLRTHPSDDNYFGVKGREYLFVEGKAAHIAASLFYLADVIRSIVLYHGKNVEYIIFVRYLMGTAYLPSPIHRYAYGFFSRIVPTKGSLIYLNVSPAEAFRRVVNNRVKTERFETIDELSKTADKALELASDGKWIIVDGDRSIPEIHEDILRAACVK
ncbi:TPA: thymidylate kinase [Candidatus Bathyarchaeota archaeon]|nr:thymidylate kinase [Candidatus Bathyarchaeota archaeon]